MFIRVTVAHSKAGGDVKLRHRPVYGMKLAARGSMFECTSDVLVKWREYNIVSISL